MFRFGKLSLCLLVVVGVGGCSAALRGFPERATVPASDLETVKPYLGVEKVNAYVEESNPAKRLQLRNEIVNARIHAIDVNFRKFEEELHQEGIGIGIGTDWVVLALTSATATIGGETAKAALGTVSSGVVGAKASFDKHALLEKGVPAIMAQMVASRKAALLTLRTGLEREDRAYSLFQALSDLENYYRAGTIPGSLAEIAKDAGQKAVAAEEGLQQVVSGSFTKDVAGATLYRYLGWDDEQERFLNTKNVENLREWLNDEGLGEVFIPTFLSLDVLSEARVKAVKKLNAK